MQKGYEPTDGQDETRDLSHLVSDDHAAYVLITCEHPKTDGSMRVEMTYDGDPVLAAYLLESAQGFLEDEG